MNSLKEALGDYIYDNYNRGKQGSFLKQVGSSAGLAIPLKDAQIKVAKKGQVLISKKGGAG